MKLIFPASTGPLSPEKVDSGPVTLDNELLFVSARFPLVSWTAMIPVIDLFAGPGGLSEGFSSFRADDGANVFRVVLSIEKDPTAHATLKLRSFFRQFPRGGVPDDYYDHLRGKLDLE